MNGVGSVDGLPGISGGDVRWIEIAKYWQRDGHDIHVFTTNAGVKLCKSLGLQATFHVCMVPDEYSLKTYILRSLKSFFIPETLDNFKGTVYSSSEQLYDVLPALKIKGNKNTWVAVVHWVAPLRRKGTSLLNSVLFFVNQRLSLRYIRNEASFVLAVSENTARQVRGVGIKKKVFTVAGGVDYLKAREAAAKVKIKRYDAVFMKRFDGTKGVFDILEIWKDVIKAKRDARLGMIGLGTKKVMTKLKEMVEAYGVGNNIEFLGPIYDSEAKFSLLAASKLFVLPSYEENWAIAIGEAMGAGVPVMCYDLPQIRPIWGDSVTWIPKGDRCKFAEGVIELLNDEQRRMDFAKKGTEFIRRYSWSEIAKKEMELILNFKYSIQHLES